MEKIDPSKGGCWFCRTTAETGDWLLSWEFDCYLHAQCLRMAVDMGDDWETEIFRNEFKEYLDTQIINRALVLVGEIAPLLTDKNTPKFKPGECFYRNIRFLRLDRQWSIRAMAKLIGMSRAHAWCLEKGLRSPTLEVVNRYAIAFDVSISNLVEQVFNNKK